MNKLLTNKPAAVYAESLKNFQHGFRTRQICDFFVFANWRMRAENNQYQPKLLLKAFSESATSQICVALLRKFNKMTNTIESTLQSLYRYYGEMKSTWYKGDYTMDQEDVYSSVFLALQDALIKLPIQTPEDRKIKLAMLKNMVLFPCETNNGVDLSSAPNMERESLELIDQLAAE